MRCVALSVSVLAVFLVCGTAAWADEADPLLSIAEAQPYRDRWQACTAAAVETGMQSVIRAETVVDRALQRCRADERALMRVLGRRVGAAEARRIVAELREYDRLVLTRIVQRLGGR